MFTSSPLFKTKIFGATPANRWLHRSPRGSFSSPPARPNSHLDRKYLLYACYNSRSQYEQKLRTASALPIDLLVLTSIQLEVSRSFTTWITGSWLQPCGPVTRTSGSRPTAGSWGLRHQKIFHGNGPSKKKLEAVLCFSEVAFFFYKIREKHVFFFEKKSNFSEVAFRLLRTWGFAYELVSCPFSLIHSPSSLLPLRTSFLSFPTHTCTDCSEDYNICWWINLRATRSFP